MHVSRVGAGGGRGGIKATMCVRGPGGGGLGILQISSRGQGINYI